MPAQPMPPTTLRTVAVRRTALALAARGQQRLQWRHPKGALRTALRRTQRTAESERSHSRAWTPLERLMRRSAQVAQVASQQRAGAAVHLHTARWALTLSPQFVQRVHRHATTVRTAVNQAPATVVSRSQLKTVVRVARPGSAMDSASAQANTRQATRTTVQTVVRQAAPRHVAAARLFARLPLTLVRNPSPAPRAAQRPPSAAAPAEQGAPQRPQQPAHWPPAAASTPPLPAQEVQRLTDHVMAQLDRRALSWHERTQR